MTPQIKKSARLAVLYALLAAALYALNVPLSKRLLADISPSLLAGLLYVGAGLGMGALVLTRRLTGRQEGAPPLTRADLPYVVAMIVLDIAAPILLMYGIAQASAANVSLLNNLEIVATTLVALLLFRERISGRLWLTIGLVTAGGVLLGMEGQESLAFNQGSLFVAGASLCWGFENNCTRRLSDKSAEHIVIIKGLGSGIGSLIVAAVLREPWPMLGPILLALVLGFVAYGLSIKFYIMAQRDLGAAKTSAFYSVAPFLGVTFSFVFLGETPRWLFYPACALMILATVLMIRDSLAGAADANTKEVCEHDTDRT